MRRMLFALPLSLLLVLTLAVPATAESQTVSGEGDIKKMFVKNGQDALTAKVYGIGTPCDGARWLNVTIKWGRTSAYKVQAACYPGETGWQENLYYYPDRDNPETARLVDCGKFSMTYNSDDVFHRVFIPRGCMGKAANGVKVLSDGLNTSSTTGGTAGPTRLLARG